MADDETTCAAQNAAMARSRAATSEASEVGRVYPIERLMPAKALTLGSFRARVIEAGDAAAQLAMAQARQGGDPAVVAALVNAAAAAFEACTRFEIAKATRENAK